MKNISKFFIGGAFLFVVFMLMFAGIILILALFVEAGQIAETGRGVFSMLLGDFKFTSTDYKDSIIMMAKISFYLYIITTLVVGKKIGSFLLRNM